MKKLQKLILTLVIMFFCGRESAAGVLPLVSASLSEGAFPNMFSQPANPAEAQGAKALDSKLLAWIKSNVSPATQLPYSFYILPENKSGVYQQVGEKNSVPGIIERMIVEEGLVVYDGAVGQIALARFGGKDEMQLAEKPVDIYWQGKVGELVNIRAGNEFIYDPADPWAVSSDLEHKGKRGFIFRIINANGRYNTKDPLDGKTQMAGFPTWDTVHWEDWKPVAGENAWVVMAALHIYHKKYYDPSRQRYALNPDSTELQLAEEIARAALLLRSQAGGIRMAPLGTYREPVDAGAQVFPAGTWWYFQISSENNVSWYAAFRMLYEITRKEPYRRAMQEIERYFQGVWNRDQGYFEQGMTFIDGEWKPNTDNFALDVQTWAITALGPEKIDGWFGEGTAFRLWQKSKDLSGCRDAAGAILGVGYTHEHDRLSVEWTAGAILAAREIAGYYRGTHPQWAREADQDAVSMRRGVETLRQELPAGQAAYAYSSQRRWIPFGWYSHSPEVLSLASTGWVIFVDNGFNPFYLPAQAEAQMLVTLSTPLETTAEKMPLSYPSK